MRIKLAMILMVVLAPLALIQYNQVGKVSRLEQEQMRAGLDNSVLQFAAQFDRELTHMFTYFLNRRPLESENRDSFYADLFQTWKDQSAFPGLIAETHLIDVNHSGDCGVQMMDMASGKATSCPWPTALASIEGLLKDPAHLGPNSGFPVFEKIPALVVPIANQVGNRIQINDPKWAHNNCLLLTLDRQYLKEVVLPTLEATYINRHEEKYFNLAVYAADDYAKPFYQSGEFPPGAVPDAAASFFGIRLGERRPPNEELKRTMHEAMMQQHHPLRGEPRIPPPSGPWQIKVQHRAGSLDAYIHRSRIRNLVINFGHLSILGITMWLLLNAAHRARKLANQQLEFVAGISHELMTPLTGINSAAQNLEDGLVSKPDRVKEYGQIIRKEGGRLVEMVERVLEFAGMQSGRTQYHISDLDLKDALDEVLDSQKSLLEAAGLEFSCQLETDLRIRADELAFSRVLRNLLGNAAKYARGGGPVEIRCRQAAAMALIEISDQGPGFDPQDLPYIFDPFYRGKAAKEAQIKGSGLGLCLVRNIVKAHGGRVEASNRSGGGAFFRIHWPLCKTADPKEQTHE